MKPLSFGHSRHVATKRPVLCSDCPTVVVAGGGEPTYTVCEPCRVRRSNAAMKARRDINHTFDPKSGYRRRKKA